MYTTQIIMLLLAITIPVTIYIAIPKVVRHYGHNGRTYRVLLLIAGVLYALSWLLPSPLIEGRDTSFMTHFVGGGLFTGFVWLYLKRSFDWKGHWWIELFSLFSLVSALGVMNELFELALYAIGELKIITDTSWDLLANTLGALMFWIGYKLVILVVRERA